MSDNANSAGDRATTGNNGGMMAVLELRTRGRRDPVRYLVRIPEDLAAAGANGSVHVTLEILGEIQGTKGPH